MLNKLKNSMIFVFLFVVACLKIFCEALFAVSRIKTVLVSGTYWFAVVYQPFLLLLLIVLFSKKIDFIVRSVLLGDADAVYIIIISVVLIVLTLFINAIIELIFCFKYSEGDYKEFLSIQQYAYTYMMTTISLIAIYVAIDIKNSTEINTMLLACGILIFICIAITDLYKALFFSQDVVKNISRQLEECYKQWKIDE